MAAKGGRRDFMFLAPPYSAAGSDAVETQLQKEKEQKQIYHPREQLPAVGFLKKKQILSFLVSFKFAYLPK